MNLNIECPNEKLLKVDELINGDVEITIAKREMTATRHFFGFLSRVNDRDKIIITKERRCVLANLLVGNETPVNETPS